MDFERIKLLLDVWHDTLNVPDLKQINAAAMHELKSHCVVPVAPAAIPAEPELDLGARRV